MKTITQEIFDRFQNAIARALGEKEPRLWSKKFDLVENELRKEFKDKKIKIYYDTTTNGRPYAGRTAIVNGEARLYSTSKSSVKYRNGGEVFDLWVCEYLSLIVYPDDKVYYDNHGNKIAEYIYEKARSHFTVQLVVYHKGEAYHFPERLDYYKNTEEKIREGIEKIKQRRKKQAENLLKRRTEKRKLNEVIDGLYVTVEDSISAGNCKYVTEKFAKELASRYNLYLPVAFSAQELLKIRDDVYVRRAILKAHENRVSYIQDQQNQQDQYISLTPQLN